MNTDMPTRLVPAIREALELAKATIIRLHQAPTKYTGSVNGTLDVIRAALSELESLTAGAYTEQDGVVNPVAPTKESAALSRRQRRMGMTTRQTIEDLWREYEYEEQRHDQS